MLIGVHDDSQIYAVDVGVNTLNFNFAPEIGGLGRRMSDFNGVERAFQPFPVTVFSISSDESSAGIFGPVTLNR